MLKPKILEYCANIATMTAMLSKDQSTKVGACIVTEDGCIISTGYNGFQRGADDNIPERNVGPEKYQWVVHAEQNALMNVLRCHGTIPPRSSLFVTHFPCTTCMGLIVQAGHIDTIYVVEGCMSDSFMDRWSEEMKTSAKMAQEADITILSTHQRPMDDGHLS